MLVEVVKGRHDVIIIMAVTHLGAGFWQKFRRKTNIANLIDAAEN